MPEDEDKYPSETGRRRFVKGVVGSAALAAVGTGSAAAISTATSPTGAGGGPTQYIGIHNVSGPAPRGMPMIPIEITDAGELKGVWPEVTTKTEAGRQIKVAETEIGGFTFSSEWFQYCGVQTYASLQPDADQDNFFRTAAGSPYDWQTQDPGTKLTVDMFDDYKSWGNGIGKSGIGKPAQGMWRSKGDVKSLPVQVIRSERVPKIAKGEGKYADIPENVRKFFDAATAKSFVAWLDKCTHFCCVPGFKTSTYANAEDLVYCPCHQSIYDPFHPVQKQFIALPRPNE
ncbi:MAG: ubiquinol-cytochrome c reductase iron-sulfur subunit [Haloarculaceae archaeon]